MVTAPRRYEVYLVNLDPTVGAEMRKTRPCVVVSPDDLNRTLKTVIIAPMTSTRWDAPFRVQTRFEGRDGSVTLDQIRTVDRSRLVRRLGGLDRTTARVVAERLMEMFSL